MKTMDFPPKNGIEKETSFSDNLRWLLDLENKLNQSNSDDKRIKTELENRNLPDNYLFNLFQDRLNKLLNTEKDGVSLKEYIDTNMGNLNPLQRLTPELVGIYNKNGELIELANTEKEQKFKPNAKTFSTLTDIPEDKKLALEDKFLDFKVLSNKFFRHNIEKDFNISLEDVDLKAQFWLMDFIKNKSTKEIKGVQKFAKKYDEEGIKTFLAMESDEKNGDKILKIGKTLDKNVAENVFSKFNEITSLTQKNNLELSEKFFNNDKTIEPAQEILKRAEQILIDYERKIDELDYGNMSKDKKLEIDKELLQNLQNIKKDIIFFATMFKTAYKGEKNVNFSEIKGVSFSMQNSQNLTEADKKMMVEIADKNYAGNKEQQKIILEGLEKSFGNGNKTRWYILKRKNGNNNEKISSFMRFDEKEDGSLYAASLNVEENLKGSALGEAMYNKAMGQEAREHIIRARAEIAKPVSVYYIEKGGFVVDGIIIDNKTKIPYFNIIRDDEVNNLYESRKSDTNNLDILNRFKLVDKNLENYFGKEDGFVYESKYSSLEMQKVIQDSSENGYVLTRLIKDKDSENVKCVFERKKQSKDYALAA